MRLFKRKKKIEKPVIHDMVCMSRFNWDIRTIVGFIYYRKPKVGDTLELSNYFDSLNINDIDLGKFNKNIYCAEMKKTGKPI